MKPMLAWSAVIGLIVAIGYAGGCSLDEMITVDVPAEARTATGSAPSVTLKDARLLLEDYDAKYRVGRDRLVAEIQDAEIIEQVGAGLVNSGYEVVVPALGTVPGGAILTGLVGALAGYLTRRTPKATLDAEYDKGRTEALDTLNEGK